jgi:hypothetical protein
MQVMLPGIRVPMPESLAVLAEIEAEFSLAHKTESSRLEMELSKLAARRCSIGQVRSCFVMRGDDNFGSRKVV